MTRPTPLDLDGFRRDVERLGTIEVPRPTPMLHVAWMRAAAEAFDPQGSFEIVAVGDPARPVAGAAFARRGGRARPHLHLLGAEDVWEPTDVLHVDAAGAAALAEALVARGLPIRFGHFPADSPFVAALRRAAGRRAAVVTGVVAGSPFIRLDPSWREPETKFSARRMRDVGRKRRKAEARGAVTFDAVTPTEADADTVLDEAMAVEAASWKSRSGTALASDRAMQAFFRAYARETREAEVLRVFFLRVGGRAVAVQIAAIADGAYWQFKIGYDEAFRDCSPGFLLMLEVVRHAAELGLDRFEFLGKAAAWTEPWTDEERPNVRLRLYPYNVRGGLTLGADAVALARRRLRDRRGGGAAAASDAS